MEPVTWMPKLEAELRRLGAFQLQGFHDLRPENVRVKDAGPDPSVVTRYDIESEGMLRDFVRRDFPGHSFLGEEGGNDVRDPAHYWLADPIDGTTNFTLGIPLWGASLGYWRDGEPQLGLIYFPCFERMFTAWRGGGAHLNGARIRTSAEREYTMLNAVALHSRTHLSHTLHLRTKARILGSVVANMCYTAMGSFMACHARAHIWDLGAGTLILEEAGAVVECAPDLRSFDLTTHRRGLPSITLFARANAHLPPLADFLRPLAPSR